MILRLLFLIAFFNVVVMDDCPITDINVAGLYFLAETIKFSIIFRFQLRFTKVKFLFNKGYKLMKAFLNFIHNFIFSNFAS